MFNHQMNTNESMTQKCEKEAHFRLNWPTVDNPLDNLETRSIVNDVVEEIIELVNK